MKKPIITLREGLVNMEQQYIRRKEAEDFTRLKNLLLTMSERVITMFVQYCDCLKNGNKEKLAAIREADVVLDDLEIQINELAVHMIARWQPVGADLRMIISAIRMSGSLERIGDYIRGNASKTLNLLNENLSLDDINASQLYVIGKELSQMLNQMSDDIRNSSDENVRKIIHEDVLVDNLYQNFYRASLTHMMENKNSISAIMQSLMMAKNLERIGDHAANIAECLAYAFEGIPFQVRRQALINHQT